MTGWSDVFLGVIAVATLAIAVAQIAVIVVAGRAARRVAELAEQFERDVKPLFGHLNAIGRDAARAAALAAAQVERADQLFTDVAVRVEQTLINRPAHRHRPGPGGAGDAQRLSAPPSRRSANCARTAVPRQGRAEDEDALFI